MDEIDAVGRHRGAGLGGGHDEREQTLNQLLVEMDGFEMKDNIILIAATNRPDILEAALLAARQGKREIDHLQLEEGIMRVIAGPEKKTRVMSEKERKVTAYHEMGHA